jgi:choline dehydrogenase-like flavoprotein
MFNFIVIGAGSAGCVVASRLTENPDISVCLLEAGGPDSSVLIHAPMGVAAILPIKFNNWGFKTTAQKGLNGRQGYQPRGRVLGGSSSINAMLYIRGHKSDYDDWANLGNEGWAWDDVLPWFKRSENNERGGDDLHGAGGPLNVADQRSPRNIGDAFIEAGAEIQARRNDDFNGPEQEGIGFYQVTQKDGERYSAAKAYLTPHLSRPNLTVVTKARVAKILIENKRAVGVAYIHQGKRIEIKAKQEVIVSGGAFGSPQTLLLSGIGPKDELQKHGIDVVHELPGVGQNLQDHVDYTAAYKSPSKDTLGVSLSSTIAIAKGIMEWRRQRTGVVTTPFAEGGAFLKTKSDLDRPDIQLHFVVGIVDDHNRKPHLGNGYSCHICVLRPKSRGRVGLNSNNPKHDPLIDPGFFSDERDLDTMAAGVRMTRQLLEAPALDPYRGKELYKVDHNDDQALKKMIRDRADTVYHPVGTCKMGSDDMAVVDNKLRVHGIDGLRVVDASIMPTLIGGNTNAPTIMIGERAVDFIRTDMSNR